MIHKYGITPLAVSYTDVELKNKISNFIDLSDYEVTYKQLCNYILNEAKKEGKLKKEANTEYSEIEMLPSDATKISRILWQKIWDKEIFIDFNKNPYSSNYPNDTVFIKY